MKETDFKDQIDVLRHIENIALNIDKGMATRSRSILHRYPLTFIFLTLFGVVAVSEGVKGILEEIPLFNNHPFYTFYVGVFILVLTGSLYKKLGKEK